MASEWPSAVCALSGKTIKPGMPHFKTTGSFLPKSDKLHTYCGQPIDWDAYADWNERPRFARAYVHEWVKSNKRNPFWWTVELNDEVYVSVNPQPGVEEASVRLMNVGTDIRVPLPKWSDWLANPDAVRPSAHTLEREEIERVLPRLREKFPTDLDLVDAIRDD